MYRVLVDGELLCDSRIDELAIINPVVNNKANNAGSFSFTISPDHPKKELIKRRLSIISVYVDDETEPIFQGIATQENTDFFNQKNYVCEGELSYFNDSIQRQAHYEGLSAQQLLETYINIHNSQVEESKRFEVGIVTVEDLSITCFTNMEPTMKSIKEDLLDDLGGYIRVRYQGNHKYIDYLAESPHTAEQIIELGKNLIDYSSNIDNTQIATSIIPQGARLGSQTVQGLEARLNIKSVNDGKDYIYSEDAVNNYGWITQVVTWDDITQPANLKTKAEQYLSETQFENVVINARAVDFGLLSDRYDRFKLLDQIRVVSPVHGMNKYFILSEQTLNLNEPEKDTVILGNNEKMTLSQRTMQANKEIMELIDQAPTPDFINAAITNATNLLKGVDGGHVKIKTDENGKPTEILIMDTEDEETAIKIWRWNLNGLGYSEDGGETYGTAITMDGAINADYITAGTIRGLNLIGTEINNGNDTFIVDRFGKVTAGNINITGGSINLKSEVWNFAKLQIENPGIDLGVVIIPPTFSNLGGSGLTVYSSSKVVDNQTIVINGASRGSITLREPGTSYETTITSRGFSTTGSKSRNAETVNYDNRLLYCYETPTPYFGDLGEGIIDETGKCFVEIDDIFSETINLEMLYQVFLQKYGNGDCWVSERTPTHFIVEGTPGLNFGWELKAVQKNFEYLRLDIPEEDIYEEYKEFSDN